MDEFLTVNEVARTLKLNPQTVRNWIDRDELRAVPGPRRMRIKREDFESAGQPGTTPAAPPSAASPAHAGCELG